MNIINYNNDNKLIEAINIIDKEFNILKELRLINVIFIKSNDEIIKFNKDSLELTINYYNIKDAIYKLFKSIKLSFNDDFTKKFDKRIEHLSYMLDLSRNSVYKVDALKKLINYLVILGYESIGLYMEDVYEITEDKYFGKFRGRYSKEELKEVVSYCDHFDIECVPYIQTLGHLSTLFDYPKNWKLLEHQDFLMLRSEDTYNFIDLMFKNIRDVFKTNNIHIGMDEVTLLGRTSFLDKYGYVDKKELMKEHLFKVVDIAKKYNFNCAIWSDMFFTSFSIQAYNDVNLDLNIELPKDIKLVFWKYEQILQKEYNKIFKAHEKLSSNIAYAGGAWKWMGFAPNNKYSFEHLNSSFKACRNNNIHEYIVTGWGDNGGETSAFATLPSLYHASNLRYGFRDKDEEFEFLTDLSLKEFMKMDDLNKTKTSDLKIQINSFCRIFLFNDLLMGAYDQFVNSDQDRIYHNLRKTYRKHISTRFGYIFNEYDKLAAALETKCQLITTFRKNYLENNLEGLKINLVQMKKLYKQMDEFIESFKAAWDKESKPQGFDIQDLRLGGVKERIRHTIQKLTAYLNGSKDALIELDEEHVDFYGFNDHFLNRSDLHDPRIKCIMSKNINY